MILHVISAVCFALISATMVVRANDLIRNGNENLKPFAFRFRIIGCALVATMPIGIVGAWMTGNSAVPFETGFRLGLLFVFVTTPYHLPWWRWISKGE